MPDTIDHDLVQEAVAALETVRRRWMRRPGVSAVDVGYRISGGVLHEDQLALRVHVVRKIPFDELPDGEAFTQAGDPTYVGRFPIDVLEVAYEPSGVQGGRTAGAQAAAAGGDDVDPRERLTPLVGGASVGNPRVTAGTLGAVVWDRTDGWPAILSNWHVLAGSAPWAPSAAAYSGTEPFYQSAGGSRPHPQSLTSLEPFYQSASAGQPFYQAAAVGEPIYQPGRFDGGTSADVVAHLSRLRVDRHMDAAVARLTGTRAYSPLILGIGVVTDVEEQPRLGMRVRKSGRSSGVTRGRIDGLSLSTTIQWGSERHYFTDQIHIVPREPWPEPANGFVEVSEGGDSGAVWVDEDTGRAVGLHFAGDVGGVPENEHALANPLWRVVDALDVQFLPPVRSLERDGGGAADAVSLARDLLEALSGGSRDAFARLLQAVADAPPRRSDAPSRAELVALRVLLDVVLDMPR